MTCLYSQTPPLSSQSSKRGRFSSTRLQSHAMRSTTQLPLPPGPKSRIPGAVFRELRRGPLEFITRLARDYGNIASFRAAGQRYVIVSHPDLAKEILLTRADAFLKGPALQNSKGILGEGLLTAEGESHRQQRRLMQPAFHARHVANYAGEVVQCTHDIVQAWKQRTGTGGAEVDVRPEMMGLTLVIAGRALFGTMLGNEIQTVHRCMDDLMNNYVRSVVPWGKLLNLLPLPSTLKLARAQRDLFSLVDRMIAARRAEPDKGNDLLSMMIAATDGEGGGARMTDKQLRDQCVTILTAGHETTANALTFTLYLLARHPAEQEKLRAEAQAVLAGGDPAPAMMDALVRTRWVLSESMRLYPPAWTMGRQNKEELELGGFRIPAKCTILIPQWTMQRDARFFPDPLAFKPDRWQAPSHPRYAYIPFSTGPRNCIGESFAWLEMMLALPLLVREFEFSIPPGTEEIKLTPAITLRPRGAVNLHVCRRNERGL